MRYFVNGQGFLKKRSAQEAEILRQLYTKSFPALYRFSVQNLEYKMEMLEAFVIMQSINMLQGLIPQKVSHSVFRRISLSLAESYCAEGNI